MSDSCKKCQALSLKPFTPELVLLQFSKYSFCDLIGKYHLHEKLIYYSVIPVLMDRSICICQHAHLKTRNYNENTSMICFFSFFCSSSFFNVSYADVYVCVNLFVVSSAKPVETILQFLCFPLQE